MSFDGCNVMNAMEWMQCYEYQISTAGGSPCDISQGLPRALTKSNKPPIS